MSKRPSTPAADRTHKDERVLELAIQDGQKQLESFLQLSIAADQRGITLGGIYLSAAAAILAAMFAGGSLSNQDKYFIIFCIILLGAGGMLCLYSTKPMRIYGVGEIPQFYAWAKKNNKNYLEVLEILLNRYIEKLEDSKIRGETKAALFRYGLVTGASALPLAWIYYVHNLFC